MELLMLLAAAAIFLGYCQTDEKVSFYGSSYIHFPVQEAKGSTNISFRFRTHLSDAILLLAAGKTDYCLIKLEAARLKVHINLGAGESEIASPRGLTLNDLSWHEIHLVRQEANMTLQIDGIHITRTLLPGKFFVLNIVYGVFIGGQGEFHELFLGHTEYMRGCMADIIYNGANVIEYTKSRQGKSEASAVTWGCSKVFDATKKTEISFLEEGAFLSISRPISRTGSRWEFELKTTSEMGLLLYNAGQASHADYLGIELHEGKVRLLMNKGNGATELIHSLTVKDGKWHKVIIDFSPTIIGISIDEEPTERLNLPSGGNRYLDLAETLYIGGTELNKRARAIARGIKSGDRSYKGCLRNMLLDSSEIGLPDVKISQGIVAGCIWSYPCFEKRPCIPSATCSQVGVNSFECTCDQPHCVTANYAESTTENGSLALDLEILAVKSIVVAEGEHAFVTRDTIAMVLDIAKYGVNEDGIIFSLAIPPEHGRLTQDSTTVSVRSFTLHDVYRNKIQYVHDGNESPEDSMILELKLTAGIGFTVPGYLQSRLRFPLNVNVTPVNDPPVLEIPTTKVLRLAQGTRKTLNKELVWTVDPDTPADMLVYTVLRTDIDAGHVEKVNQSSVGPIETFTQSELAHGLISYVHHGNTKSNAMLGLRVTDGQKMSKQSFLRISAYPLQIKFIHNTGLVVVHQSFSYLTIGNLSFATNSDDKTVEILYSIIVSPQYGVVQKLIPQANYWTNVENFTNKDIEAHIIRYLHNAASPAQDVFKFQASVGDVKTQQTFDFKITFIDMELKEIKQTPVEFTANANAKEIRISNENLKYQTNPLMTSTSNIEFTIVKPTNFGNIIVSDDDNNDNDDRYLVKGDKFTQEDIDMGKLTYRLFKRAYSSIDDEILFQVSAPQCQPLSSSLSIKYSIGASSKPSLSFSSSSALPFHPLTTTATKERLNVKEGSQVALSITRINPKDYKVNGLLYNISQLPQHGSLSIQCISNQTARSNIISFTSEELASQSVFYVHDDSETTKDSFQYFAVSTDDTDFMYVGTFNIDITLINDNPPELSATRVFDVVINGERVITSKDLMYIDRDEGTRPEDLIYIIRNVTNGEIYSPGDHPSNTAQRLQEFTQQDINYRRVLFKHHGDDKGYLDYYVSDGNLRTPGSLRIQASAPYVRFVETNASIVQYNSSLVLTTKDFDIATNVDISDKDVKFTISSRSKHGVILKNNLETSSFTREELAQKMVSYRHLGGSMTKDEFRVNVTLNGEGSVSAETRVIIKVYPKGYWEPLIVHNNRVILVEETTSVLIGRKNLEIGHPKIPSAEITYLIREWPRNGYLEIQTPSEGHTSSSGSSEEAKDDYEANLVRHFDQSVINEGRVYYVQSVANQTEDSFVADVTNGITWMRGLVIDFIIIPDKLYIKAGNLSVVEGKNSIIEPSNFHVITTYYSGKLTDYRIVDKPKHGLIMDSVKQNQVKKFSQKHLDAGIIYYKHNGDESYTDYFQVTITAGDKTSQPVDVWVNIQPVNDQIPVLLNQSVIKLWQGGSSIITSSNLSAFDNDTQPSDIVYNVTRTKNVYLSLVNLSNVDIYNFTQKQINQSEVLITHTNGTDGYFSFTLFDGLHTTQQYNITVETMPVKLSIYRNDGLNIFPLTRKPITDKLLLVMCTDKQREIKYIVRRGPHLGKIIMETNEGTWQEVDRFTQQDLNNSKVTYEHTKQFMDLSTNDSFIFDVETPFAEIIKNQIFQIDVSVSSGGLGRYITINPVHVEEGGTASVSMNITGIIKYLRTKTGIENPVVLSHLTNQPTYGHVMLLPDLNITTFTQPQIEDGRVAYYHDHSDSTEDNINFSVYLTPGHVMLCNATIPVIISPVNDQPFKLVTKNPFITVVQNQTQTIDRESLLTTDADTPPEELVYDVISAPTAGRLLLFTFEQNSSEVRQVNKFTQQDVDSNRLVYEHNGSSQPVVFYFRVSDGRFTPVYTLFNVHVLPIKLNITTPNPVTLQQGFNMGIVTEENIRLDTNARHEHVTYEITSPPRHGTLYVRDIAAIKFKHPDLLSKSVVFVQTDMTASNDSFILSARLSDYEVWGIQVTIKVVPLMIIRPMLAFAGDKNQITLKSMDATPLAEATNGNPIYRITGKSQNCKLKRIIRNSGDKRTTREREISRFSHRDIILGVIYVVCRRKHTTDTASSGNASGGFRDSFNFTLTASTYQPADGVLEMKIKSDPEVSNNTLGGPMDPVGHEGEMALAPNINHDYILILGMLLGVFVLGILTIILIRCRHKRYKGNQENKTNEPTPTVGVIPLPRPPDHLMPVTPHLKRYDHDHMDITSSTPLPSLHSSITSSLPQCKVIPLNPLDSIAGSDADISARYPYGVADADEWSSFDTSELPPLPTTTRRTAPLLRRNQYWV
ncbi:Similar to CSPG4: Chondroitin sulfate proteoglycan 4 (Homo sapiens) [Cotesia congregata]|uniref:Similar to CSPG4: Chondroitin sulfate proteoglycan 4 (Homo sapiens) n=1 Tax=Cotesia congregata TaxID=51543 RepID=A0A8J2HD51_COTCN|nr:Similar to CSPG4: Chondroitin sulfate proteoglycan 4 (Homo sapiens) [Cotesia congregata]